MIEEKISPTILTAMRSMYQTKAGRLTLMLPTTQLLMKEGSQIAGKHEDDPKSVEKIPRFIKVRFYSMDDYSARQQPEARQAAMGFARGSGRHEMTFSDRREHRTAAEGTQHLRPAPSSREGVCLGWRA
jgi:hypothetical protein